METTFSSGGEAVDGESKGSDRGSDLPTPVAVAQLHETMLQKRVAERKAKRLARTTQQVEGAAAGAAAGAATHGPTQATATGAAPGFAARWAAPGYQHPANSVREATPQLILDVLESNQVTPPEESKVIKVWMGSKGNYMVLKYQDDVDRDRAMSVARRETGDASRPMILPLPRGEFPNDEYSITGADTVEFLNQSMYIGTFAAVLAYTARVNNEMTGVFYMSNGGGDQTAQGYQRNTADANPGAADMIKMITAANLTPTDMVILDDRDLKAGVGSEVLSWKGRIGTMMRCHGAEEDYIQVLSMYSADDGYDHTNSPQLAHYSQAAQAVTASGVARDTMATLEKTIAASTVVEGQLEGKMQTITGFGVDRKVSDMIMKAENITGVMSMKSFMGMPQNGVTGEMLAAVDGRAMTIGGNYIEIASSNTLSRGRYLTHDAANFDVSGKQMIKDATGRAQQQLPKLRTESFADVTKGKAKFGQGLGGGKANHNAGGKGGKGGKGGGAGRHAQGQSRTGGKGGKGTSSNARRSFLTEECGDHKRGNCNRGDSCKYAHVSSKWGTQSLSTAMNRNARTHDEIEYMLIIVNTYMEPNTMTQTNTSPAPAVNRRRNESGECNNRVRVRSMVTTVTMSPTALRTSINTGTDQLRLRGSRNCGRQVPCEQLINLHQQQTRDSGDRYNSGQHLAIYISKSKRRRISCTPTLKTPRQHSSRVGDKTAITTMCLLLLVLKVFKQISHCASHGRKRLNAGVRPRTPFRLKRTKNRIQKNRKMNWCRIINTNRDVLVLSLLGAACLPVAHAADSVATSGHTAPFLTTIAAGIAAAATAALATHTDTETDDEDAETHAAAEQGPHLETKEENTDDDKETKEERDPSLAGSAASTGGMSCGTCGITRAPTAFTLDQMNRGDAGRCNTCVLGRSATIQDGAWLGDPMGAPGFEKMYLKQARYKKQKWTRRATHARQQHAEGFLAHFKNVNGADLLGTGVIHSILEAILDHQYDVLCLVDIKANSRPLTGFTAAQVQQAISTWSSTGKSRDACPFHAKIAYDESGVLTGAGGVILIYRKQLRLPAFTADPHGRWLSAEFIGRKNKALHVIGAYAFPTAFSTLNPANRIIAESMNDNITQRMLHLPLPPRKRPKSSLCKESRQGFPLLMADTNSTFDNRDRAQGEQRTGTNNKWPARERALGAEKGTVDIPNKPKTKKYGTNGQDGPGSLAWELKHNGIVSVLRHIHPTHTGKGRDQLCTYRLSNTNMSTRWSLIDHICIHNTKAASKVNSVGIDAGNTIIPGSDHHGISISLKFKQIFGDTKRNIYKRPPSVMPAPEIPKFTPTEIQIITTHITTNTEWQSQLQKASEAALDPDLDAESARGKITELWFEICKVYQQAWESIIAKRNSQSTTHRARRHAPQKHLSALRALTRTLFDRTRGSLAAAVLDRKPAQLDSILTRTHDAWLTLHNVFERYGFKLNAPPKLSPSGKQSLAAVEQKYHTTAIWLSTNEVLYHDAIFALRDRVRALDQRAHAKWLGTRQSDFRCKQRRFLDSTFARAVDAVDLDYISVDPNPEHPSGIIDDPTQVKEAVGTFFHNWMEHMSCPNDTNECSHPAPAKRCKPPKLGGKWIESFKDETTRNRPAYRTVGQDDASRLTGQAQAAHRMAQTKANIQDHWADDVMAPWSATQVQNTARVAGIKDTRAGISGITARLIRDSPPALLQGYADMFNAIQLHWVVPDPMKIGLIHLLRKDPNKPTMAHARPITLLECPLKMYTKGLQDRLQHALQRHEENHGPVLETSQYGALFNRNATNALWSFTNALEDANEHGKEAHMLACDVSHAYDNAEHWALEVSARRLKLPEGFIRVLADMDTQAKSRVITQHGNSPDFLCERGVRQGDSLSPTRYLIFIDGLLEEFARGQDPYVFGKHIHPDNSSTGDEGNDEPFGESKSNGGQAQQPTEAPQTQGQAFIDDLIPISATFEGIKERAEALTTFLQVNAGCLNAGKTFHISLNTKGPQPTITVPTWSRTHKRYLPTDLAEVDEHTPFRYLGVWLTARLSFKKQHTNLTNGLQRMLTTITSSPLTPEMLVHVINTVIIPRMLFAIQVTHPKDALLDEWDQTIQKACRRHLETKVLLPITADPLYRPVEELGLGLASIKEKLYQRQLQNLTVALNSTHPQLGPTTRHRWHNSAPDAPSLVRRIANGLQKINIQIKWRNDNGPHNIGTNAINELERGAKFSSSAPQNTIVEGTNLGGPPAVPQPPQGGYWIFASDGALDPETNLGGAALVCVSRPDNTEWGGHEVVEPTNEGRPIYNSEKYNRFEVRRWQLRCPSITEWPISLPEAWPLLQSLATTPKDAHIILYTDSLCTIQTFNKLVQRLKGPVSDMDWTKITDRWIWQSAILPLAREREQQGGTITLRHVRSHIREKGLTQEPGYTVINETADEWAGKGATAVGHRINLQSLIDATAPTYHVTRNDVVVRDRIAVVAKGIFAEIRTTDTRKSQSTGTILQFADAIDASATRGALDWSWATHTAISPSNSFQVQSFAYILRYGLLPTTHNLTHDWAWSRRGEDFSWLKKQLEEEANECNLPKDRRLRKREGGADDRCQVCMQSACTVPHALQSCPHTLQQRKNATMHLARLVEGIGYPGITSGQAEPSTHFTDEHEFQSHLTHQTNCKQNVTGKGVRQISFPDPTRIGKIITMRADIYWHLWKTSHNNHDTIEDVIAQVAHDFNAAIEGAKADAAAGTQHASEHRQQPLRIPLGLERWIRDSLHIKATTCMSTCITHTTNTFQTTLTPIGVAGTWDTCFKKVTMGRKQLQHEPIFINAAHLPEHELKKLCTLAGNAVKHTPARRPVRIIALLPDNKEVMKVVTGKTQGAIILKIPTGRFPKARGIAWLTGHARPSRDTAWCAGRGLRLVVWENIAATKKLTINENTAHHLQNVCCAEMAGGSTHMSFQWPHKMAADLTVSNKIPENPVIMRQRLRPLRSLHRWLVEPLDIGLDEDTCYGNSTPPIPPIEINDDVTHAINAAAAAPRGLRRHLEEHFGTTSAKHDARSIVAALAATHLHTWNHYEKLQDTAIQELYSSSGLGGTAPHHRTQYKHKSIRHTSQSHADLSPPCSGIICAELHPRDGMSEPTPVALRQHLDTTDNKLKCQTCRQAADNTWLLREIITHSKLPGLRNNTAPNPNKRTCRERAWPSRQQGELHEVYHYVKKLQHNLSMLDVAAPGVIPHTFLSDGYPGTNMMRPNVIIWIAYLKHHNRLEGEIVRLWRAVPPSHRPNTTKADDTWFQSFGLTRTTPGTWSPYGTLPPTQPPLRCTNAECTSQCPKPKWRQSHRAHLCESCHKQYNALTSVLRAHQADEYISKAVYEQDTLPPLIKRYIQSTSRDATYHKLCGKNRPPMLKSLRQDAGQWDVVWMHHCRRHNKVEAALTEHLRGVNTSTTKIARANKLANDMCPAHILQRHGINHCVPKRKRPTPDGKPPQRSQKNVSNLATAPPKNPSPHRIGDTVDEAEWQRLWTGSMCIKECTGWCPIGFDNDNQIEYKPHLPECPQRRCRPGSAMPFEHKPKKAKKKDGKSPKRLLAFMRPPRAKEKNTAKAHALIEGAMKKSDAQAKKMLIAALSNKVEHQTSAEVFQSIHAYLVHEGHDPQEGKYGRALQSKDNKIITTQMLAMHRSTVNHRRLVQAKAEKVVQLYMTTRQEKSNVTGTQAPTPRKKQRAQPQSKPQTQGGHTAMHHPPAQRKAGARRAKNKTKTGATNKAVVSQPTTHTPVAGPKTAPAAKKTRKTQERNGNASKKHKTPHKQPEESHTGAAPD